MPEPQELSEREREILRLVATGATNKEIAQRLFISSNTVKVHLRNIFAKIGAASRTEAAMYAVKIGLVPAGEVHTTEDQGLAEERLPGGETAVEGEAILPVSSTLNVQRPKTTTWIAILSVLGVALVAVVLFLLFNRPENGQAIPSAPLTTVVPARWQARASMPTARYGFGLAVYQNQLYALAGNDEQGTTGAVERYDLSGDQWESLQSKPTPVGDVAAAVLGGKIYIPGGRLQDGSLTNSLEIYDPASGAWENGPALPQPRSAYALATFEGQLFLFGGWDGQRYVDNVFVFDPGSGQWKESAPMPTARGYAAAAAAGGRIYVLGGEDAQGPLVVNEVFSPDNPEGSDAWAKAADLPQPRYGMGAATVADIIHIVGGAGEGEIELPSLEYLPMTDSWNIYSGTLTQAAEQIGLAPVEAFLFAVGGKASGVPSNQNQSYQVLYTVAIPLVR